MRILREGQMELVERSRKFECDNCKCVFIADKNEYRYNGNQREGDIWQCDCPFCGKMVITSQALRRIDYEHHQ